MHEEEDDAGIYTGLAQELWGYRSVLEMGLDFPIPPPVYAFFQNYYAFLLENDLPGHLSLQKLIAARTGFIVE